MSLRSLPLAVALVAVSLLASTGAAGAPPHGCTECASHSFWPTIDGLKKIAQADGDVRYTGTARSDELLGHHGSDVLHGGESADVLWGDWDPKDQPTTQVDRIYGAGGNDLIYGSHGRNLIYAGAGNDAISVHYGRGLVDCGPGRDIYHVARSRAKAYTFRNCEKVDYRPESVRGTGLRPLR